MVELDSEGEMTRSEVANFLREFADEIDLGTHGGDQMPEGRQDELEGEHREEFLDEDSVEPRRITLIVGGDSATVTIPETVELDVEVDSRSPLLSSGVHQEIGFELSWEIEDADELDGDQIEVE